MSEYRFQCWNKSCGDLVERDWDEVEEDISGRMAYCSQACFEEDCTNTGNRFNENYPHTTPYVVGNKESEENLLQRLRQCNPYIAHSIEEEEVDTFSGNWHYVWVPDLTELKAFAQEEMAEGEDLNEAMKNIHYSDWEEFMMFTHPVKGIALVNAWERLQGLSISVYISQDTLKMHTTPSHPDFIE